MEALEKNKQVVYTCLKVFFNIEVEFITTWPLTYYLQLFTGML